MARFLARRLAWTLLVVWFVLSGAFAIQFVVPGDPVAVTLGPHATPETVALVRKHMGLDRPMIEQYGHYFARVLEGDLGTSYRLRRPVTQVIGRAIWPTFQLALAAMLVQLLLGVALGVVAAVRRNTWQDSAARLLALVAQSAPTFFVGPLLIYFFAYKLGWFPIGGYGEGFLDRLHHLILPALTLATLGTAVYTRLVRSDMIEVLGEDYVRTARAKGLPGRTVVWHHALRNALLPLVTLVGLDLGVLLGGAIVTEAIFQWPGMGREAMQGIMALDLPVVLGVVLVAAGSIVLANLAVDLLYAWLDPRVRLE